MRRDALKLRRCSAEPQPLATQAGAAGSAHGLSLGEGSAKPEGNSEGIKHQSPASQIVRGSGRAMPQSGQTASAGQLSENQCIASLKRPVVKSAPALRAASFLLSVNTRPLTVFSLTPEARP